MALVRAQSSRSWRGSTTPPKVKKTVVITDQSDGTKVVGFAWFPYSGQILLDGHDIRMLNLRWLRQ